MNPHTRATVIEDTMHRGKRIATMQLAYPRFIHSEFMTHRVFSRNASSSRAVPTSKLIEQVRTNPVYPSHWGSDRPGMQAGEEVDDKLVAEALWVKAAMQAADSAEFLSQEGLHKQVVNRVLEPFTPIHVVVTATEWDNFFELRCHKDAQPEIRELAQCMRKAIGASEPRVTVEGSDWIDDHLTDAEFWHLPYVRKSERESQPLYTCRLLSAARCARVSYLNHDKTEPVKGKDIELATRLFRSRHMSPFEHQACGSEGTYLNYRTANFRGWAQFRQLIELGVPHSGWKAGDLGPRKELL